MNTYECLYCGVTYKAVGEMRSCAVCGQRLEGLWFQHVAVDRKEVSGSRNDERASVHDAPRRAA